MAKEKNYVSEAVMRRMPKSCRYLSDRISIASEDSDSRVMAIMSVNSGRRYIEYWA